METKRISIIIPIYNSEKFFIDCIESVLKQVTSDDEIILIDDCSTDDSLSICELYKGKYPDIIRIIRKEKHGGPSESRNIGNEQALGSYVFYIDSDDFISQNALNIMYDYAVQNNCEIVQSAFYYAYTDYLLLDQKLRKKYPTSKIISKEKAMEHLVRDGLLYNFVWGKLYKTELVKTSRFPEDIDIGEDLFWQHRVVHIADRIGIIPTPLYYYRQGPMSLSNMFTERHIALLKAYEDRLKFIKGLYPSLYSDMLFAYWKQAYQCFRYARNSRNKECKELFGHYWNNLNRGYQEEFNRCIKDRLEYMLYRRSESLLSSYLFVKGFASRFSSNLKKMPIKK